MTAGLVNLWSYLAEISRPRPKVTAGYIFFPEPVDSPTARGKVAQHRHHDECGGEYPEDPPLRALRDSCSQAQEERECSAHGGYAYGYPEQAVGGGLAGESRPPRFPAFRASRPFFRRSASSASRRKPAKKPLFVSSRSSWGIAVAFTPPHEESLRPLDAGASVSIFVVFLSSDRVQARFIEYGADLHKMLDCRALGTTR